MESLVSNQSGQPAVSSAFVEPFDPYELDFLQPDQVRNVREHHAEFLESLTASLAKYLSSEVLLEIAKVKTLAYRDFVASVRTPAHLTLLKVEPLRGVCIVDIEPKLGFAMVDRLLGGSGNSLDQAPVFGEIETALLDRIVQLIVGGWCNTRNKSKNIRPTRLGHESTAQYLQTSPPDATMLVIAMDVRIGECAGKIQVVLPWRSAEPLFGQFTIARIPKNLPKKQDSPRPRWRPEFSEIPVRVTAQGPAVEIAARDLAGLRLGDTLDLDPHFANQINVRVGDIAKFTGRLGFSDGTWAVEITTIPNIDP